jgi:hypothetical protein
MVHILELAVSGTALCFAMTFAFDKLASDLFRAQPEAGVMQRGALRADAAL